MTQKRRIWWAALSYVQVQQVGQLAASVTSHAVAVGVTVFALFARPQVSIQLLKSLMGQPACAQQGLGLALWASSFMISAGPVMRAASTVESREMQAIAGAARTATRVYPHTAA